MSAFERIINNGESLNRRLIDIYSKELYISGRDVHFLNAKRYFQELSESEYLDDDLGAGILAICIRACRISGDYVGLLKYVSRAAAGSMMCSEICCELGEYFHENGDDKEAIMWYVNALKETEADLNIKYGEEIPRAFLTERQVVV